MRQDEYDSYEEYEEAQEQKARTNNVPSKKGGTEVAAPEPIVYHDAVRSFTSQYEAKPYWANADIQFLTLGDLRKLFAAVVPFGVPDAMPIILDYLANQGFTMQHVPGFTEPVMCVERKAIEDVDSSDDPNRYLTL